MSDVRLQRRNTISSLQAGRAVAALLVLFYHASVSIFAAPKYFDSLPFGRLFHFGYAGVDFFFVLSGFIMMHAHRGDLGNPGRLGKYLWKRVTRIYLPYWLVLVGIVPVFFLVPQFGTGQERQPWILATSILLVPHPGSYFVLVVAWTLAYEVCFYLLFALLIVNRRLGGCVFAVWLGLILCPFRSDAFLWSFFTDLYNLRFLAGMAVAWFVQGRAVPLPRTVALCGAAIFLITGLFDAYSGPLEASARAVGYTVGSMLIIAGLVQAERTGLLSMPRWLTFLGDGSYAIYLIHFPALSVLAKISKMLHLDSLLPGPVLFLAIAGAATGLSCLFYWFLERPLIAWAKRPLRTDKRRPTTIPLNASSAYERPADIAA